MTFARHGSRCLSGLETTLDNEVWKTAQECDAEESFLTTVQAELVEKVAKIQLDSNLLKTVVPKDLRSNK